MNMNNVVMYKILCQSLAWEKANIEFCNCICYQVAECSQRSGSGKSRTESQSGVTKGNVSSARTPSSNTRSAPAKSSPNTGIDVSSSFFVLT